MKKYFDSLINTSGAPVVAASISVYNYGTTTLASKQACQPADV